MKNAIKILIILYCFSINCKAQTVLDITQSNLGDNSNKYFKDTNNYFANFTGTWENTTGNITFRVTLWKETKVPNPLHINCFEDEIHGSFKIIQNVGMLNEVVLHNSVKYYPVNNATSYSMILMKTVNGIGAAGSIDDNCLPNGGQLGGRLRMEITNLGQTPSIARWTVKRGGPSVGPQPVFTVPIDIILTKVN